MITTILATKLYIPPPRPKDVLRPRLIERLNEGLAVGHTPGVTLISAPVGYEKTTLVSEWIQDCRSNNADRGLNTRQSPISNLQSPISNPQFCWLSLDEGDNDPIRFLAYLVAALQTLPANNEAAVLNDLQASQFLPIESVLTG